MSLQKAIPFVFIATLAACESDPPSLTPPGHPDDFLRAADVLAAAQCELDEAASRSGRRYDAESAEITLTLVVEASEQTGGGVTLNIPIGPADLTLRRNRAPQATALRVMDFRIRHDFGTALVCPTAESPITDTGIRYIEGGLGLADWLAETDRLVEHTGRAPSELNYAMTFDFTVSSDRSPAFSRPIEAVDAGVSRRDREGRESSHRIAVTIVPAGTRNNALQDAANRFLGRVDE